MKKLWSKIGIGALMVLASMPSWAFKLSEGAINLNEEVGSVGDLMITIFLVIGIVLVGAGLLKLKAHKDNPQQVPLSQPITMLIVGGLLTVILGIMTIAPDSAGLVGEGNSLEREETRDLFN